MMKRIVFLLMILCLLPCAALAADGDLPDVEAFSNGLLEIDPDKTEVSDYSTQKVYWGTDEDVLFVATEYISLLTEKYGMDEICHFPITTEYATHVYWAFEYTKSAPRIGSGAIWSDSEGWKIDSYQVLIAYSQSDNYEKTYIRIYYRSEFNYIDTGDRIDVSAKPAAPVECPACDGTGNCQKCLGDGWFWGFEYEYVDGSPKLVRKHELCHASGCNFGSCYNCGGDGVLD